MNTLKRLSPVPLLRRFVETIRLEIRLRRGTPVFVFQMGKVGSVSVYNSFLEQYPGAVLHVHNFTPVDPDHRIRRLYRWVVQDGKPIYIISLTREPVSRNISAFFQNFRRTTGVPYENSNYTLDELREIFLSNYPHDIPLEWFDKNILKNFGIDVYATSFPANGVATYSQYNAKLLVMRSEISDEEKEGAIRDFLQFPDFRLSNRNISDNKQYASLYKAFTKTTKLPDDYITKMCTSKYFVHFYGVGEAGKVKARWG